MKRLNILLLLGLITLFFACEKEGEQVTYQEPPVLPAIVEMPDLALTRDRGNDTITFVGTPVDPGFTASATYFLEAAVAGTEFAEIIQLYSGTQVDAIKLTVAEVNQKLLDILPEDQTSSADFRIRCQLVVDAGTGAPGAGDFEYNSTTTTENVTLFGLLRLDLNNSGIDPQKVVSPAGDGKYEGLVKLDPANAFTLTDPETSTNYGGAGGTLAVDGAGIVVNNAGWHILRADIIGLTYDAEEYFIGIIGSATPTGWDSDTDMEYNPEEGHWYIDIDLVGGDGMFIKFRKNDGWSWNMGLADGDPGGLSGNLQQGGVGNDIPIPESGNYRVIFTILSDAAGTYEIIKN